MVLQERAARAGRIDGARRFPAALIRRDVFYWGQPMAAALLGSVPAAFIYSFFGEPTSRPAREEN